MINPCKELLEEKTVYRILDKETNSFVGVYSRAARDEIDFGTESQARRANCHGVFEDTDRYDVVKLTRFYVKEKYINESV